MALLLVFSLLPGICLTADAAVVDYQYGSTSKYSNIIKNWGVREEVATFLSPNAETFSIRWQLQFIYRQHQCPLYCTESVDEKCSQENQ